MRLALPFLLSTALSLLSPLAHAGPITGQMTVTGNAGWNPIQVFPGGNASIPAWKTTGSFATFLGSGSCGGCVVDPPFYYNNTGTVSEFIFYMTTGSPVFVLNHLLTVDYSNTSLHLTGTGMVSMLGYDPTSASWDFNDIGGFFSETITANPPPNIPVPEPTSVALLGTALLCLGAISRRLRRP